VLLLPAVATRLKVGTCCEAYMSGDALLTSFVCVMGSTQLAPRKNASPLCLGLMELGQRPGQRPPRWVLDAPGATTHRSLVISDSHLYRTAGGHFRRKSRVPCHDIVRDTLSRARTREEGASPSCYNSPPAFNR
jgi:hypothetical protein